MTGLSNVFLCKILFTILCWSLPLLVVPETLIIKIGIPIADNIIFLRLLGMAYTALLVGYILAFKSIRQGKFPIETVWVGIVSNGGASSILLICGLLGYRQSWGEIAQGMMWFFSIMAGAITVGLIATGLVPQHSD